MKTFLLAILVVASQSFAQNTLTSANNPVVGNIDKNYLCDTVNLSEGNSGSNQTWNFTNLTITDSSTVNFVSVGSTPYAAQFPNSNIASTNDNSSFNYFNTSQTNILVNGFAGADLTIPYSNAETFLEYPFTFNSTFTDQFASVYNAFGAETYRTGTTTVSGDAWGTINLPNGNFSNALRVNYFTQTRDSSNIGVPLVTDIISRSYVWFAPGRKFPVFQIIYTYISLNGTPFVGSKVIDYSPSSPVIGINIISNETPSGYELSQNYPNPFNPSTKINFAVPVSGLVSLVIFNELGREVEKLVNQNLNAGSYEFDWNAAEYPSGVYFYRLESDQFVETKKMILSK